MAAQDGQPQARGASVDHGREPCPDRILDDMGGAFGMGAVGGGLWHFFKGLKNSPSNARMRGGLEVGNQGKEKEICLFSYASCPADC